MKTIKEVAEETGYSEGNIRHLAKKKMPAGLWQRFGNRFAFSPEAVAWIKARVLQKPGRKRKQ